jgi:hypothetical protein
LIGQLGVHAGTNILSESWPNGDDKDEKNPKEFPRAHGYRTISAWVNLRPGSKNGQRISRNRYVPGGAPELTTVTTRTQATLFPITGPVPVHAMQPTTAMTAVAYATAMGANDRQTRIFEQQNARREAATNTRSDARWGKGRIGFDPSQRIHCVNEAKTNKTPHL